MVVVMHDLPYLDPLLPQFEYVLLLQRIFLHRQLTTCPGTVRTISHSNRWTVSFSFYIDTG
jgi:hypothetical protein